MTQESRSVLMPAQGNLPKIGDVVSRDGARMRVLDIIGNVKKPYLVLRIEGEKCRKPKKPRKQKPLRQKKR